MNVFNTIEFNEFTQITCRLIIVDSFKKGEKDRPKSQKSLKPDIE